LQKTQAFQRSERCADMPPASFNVRTNETDIRRETFDPQIALTKIMMTNDRRGIEHCIQRRYQAEKLLWLIE